MTYHISSRWLSTFKFSLYNIKPLYDPSKLFKIRRHGIAISNKTFREKRNTYYWSTRTRQACVFGSLTVGVVIWSTESSNRDYGEFGSPKIWIRKLFLCWVDNSSITITSLTSHARYCVSDIEKFDCLFKGLLKTTTNTSSDINTP